MDKEEKTDNESIVISQREIVNDENDETVSSSEADTGPNTPARSPGVGHARTACMARAAWVYYVWYW